MTLPELYLYFARFVPKTALARNHVTGSRPADSAEIQTEALAAPDDLRIDELTEYLFIGDTAYTLERLRNSKDMLLFVDSDRLDVTFDTDGGVRMRLAVTVATHYPQSNRSMVGEIAMQNRCLDILTRILRTITYEAENECPVRLQLANDYEIRFFGAAELNGLIGYTAFFTITGSDYAPMPDPIARLHRLIDEQQQTIDNQRLQIEELIERLRQYEGGGIEYVHSFADGLYDAFFTISGKLSSAYTKEVRGQVIEQSLKMETNTSISFRSGSAGVLTLYAYNSKSSSYSVRVDGERTTLGADGVAEVAIGAGEHTITKDTANTFLFYLALLIS